MGVQSQNMPQKWCFGASSDLREIGRVSGLVNSCLDFKIIPLFIGKGLRA